MNKNRKVDHGPLQPWLPPQFPYRASALKSPGTLVSQCISVILGSHVYFLGVGVAISLEKIIQRDPTMIIPSQWTDWREHLQKNAALTPQIYGSPVFQIACIISKAKGWTGKHGLRPSFEKADLK